MEGNEKAIRSIEDQRTIRKRIKRHVKKNQVPYTIAATSAAMYVPIIYLLFIRKDPRYLTRVPLAAKPVLDRATGILYESQNQCAMALGISPVYLSKYLNNYPEYKRLFPARRFIHV